MGPRPISTRRRRHPSVTRDLRDALAAAAALEAEHKGKLAELDGVGAGRGDRALRADRGAARPGRRATPSCCTPRRPTTRRSGASSRPCRSGSTRPAPGSCSSPSRSTGSRRTALAAKVAQSPRLAHYQPWLRDVRSFRPHQLDDEIERVLHEKSVTGRSAWVRLFDETMAGLRFPLDGRELTSAEIFDLLSDKDRARRAAAANSIAGVLGAQHPPVRPDHQHARQGQADRGRLAAVPAPDLEPQPRQSGRGRGRRRADRRGPGGLPAPVAPLLRDQGALARPRAAGVLGPQRALAGGRRPAGRLARSQGHRARCLPPLLAAPGRDRRALLRRQLDRRRACARARMRARSAIRPCRARIPTC